MEINLINVFSESHKESLTICGSLKDGISKSLPTYVCDQIYV